MTNLTLIDWLFALLPIVTVLALMVARQWSGAKAGFAGWLVALVLAASWFGSGADVLLFSQLRAILLSIYVLYIIWASLLLYNVVKEAGAIEVISASVGRLTGDRLMQLLLLAWVFASFLQGVTGYGVPIAVVAPLLVGLGFAPEIAVVASALGHGWAVTFGSIAASFYAMIAVTDLPGDVLAPPAALLLGLSCFGCGAVVAHMLEGWRGVARGVIPLLAIGATMSIVQYGLAVAGLWGLASFLAGFAGLIVGGLLTRLPSFNRAHTPLLQSNPMPRLRLSPLLAFSPYLILMVVVLLAAFISPLSALLDRVELNLTFPAVMTARGWIVAPGEGRSISIFGHAGALIAYAAIIAFVIFSLTGSYRDRSKIISRIWRGMLRSAVPSSLGILTMVGMALFMDNSGMTFVLAKGLANALGGTLALVSPFIGAIGAFMTGSNTNSNVVFAPLQRQLAELINISTPLILAGQTTGGAIGSTLSPAKIIVGASTAGLAGREGPLLRLALTYGVILLLFISVIMFFLTRG